MTDRPDPAPTPEDKVQRLGRNGHLHRVIPIVDSTGKVVHRVVKPLMVEFRSRDALQTMVGATILAIPAAYTEEAWNLGSELSMGRIAGIALTSLTFIALFVYFNFYKSFMQNFVGNYVVRVVSTYVIALVVVAGLLTLVDQCPWNTDLALCFKRIVVVAFPASMSATVADALK